MQTSVERIRKIAQLDLLCFNEYIAAFYHSETKRCVTESILARSAQAGLVSLPENDFHQKQDYRTVILNLTAIHHAADQSRAKCKPLTRWQKVISTVLRE